MCEGDTELAYFAHVRDRLHEPGVIVKSVRGRSSDPVAVVQTAIDERDGVRQSGSPPEYYQVWAVFDHDGRTPRVREAQSLATRNGIAVGFSNPCFEVWLLWHVIDFMKSCDQKEVERALLGSIPGYVKGSGLDARPFAGRLSQASDRAAKARAVHDRAGCVFPDARPTTDLDRTLSALTKAASRRRGGSIPAL